MIDLAEIFPWYYIAATLVGSFCNIYICIRASARKGRNNITKIYYGSVHYSIDL